MTTVASDGTKVFRQEVVPALLPMLDSYGVEAVDGDPTRVKLVQRTQPNQVSARQWAEGYGKYAIAAVEWLPSAHEPKFLRAVAPSEARAIAPPTGFYAILTGPILVTAQWPQQPGMPVPPPGMPIPGMPPGMPVPGMPTPPTGLEELPPDVRTKVTTLLAGTNAEAMESTANELEKQGYASAAEVVRKRAADVRLASTISNTAAGRTYTVRGSELPSQLAQWYTGDANRWRELVETNKELQIRKSGTIEYVTPWKAGMTIILPATWHVKKGPMPIQSAARPPAPAPANADQQVTLTQFQQTPPPK